MEFSAYAHVRKICLFFILFIYYFGLGGGRQHCENGTTHYGHDSEHATLYLQASVSSFRSCLSPAEGLAALGSYNPRARSLGTLNGHKDLGRQHRVHALPRGLDLLRESPRQPFGEQNKRIWHGKHDFPSPILYLLHFRVHCFVLVCYRQNAHSGDTWHFPVGQNDPKYSTFFAKLELFLIILQDKKESHCTEAHFANIKLISVDDYSTLSGNPTVHQVLSEYKVSHILHPVGIITIQIRQVNQTNTNNDSFPKRSGHF